jgi:hypothetical protein
MEANGCCTAQHELAASALCADVSAAACAAGQASCWPAVGGSWAMTLPTRLRSPLLIIRCVQAQIVNCQVLVYCSGKLADAVLS